MPIEQSLPLVLPENTYCLIFLTFFRGTVNLVPTVMVRIQNHEAHCLRAVTTCVYRDPFAGFPAARDCGTATSTCCVSEDDKAPADYTGDRILWSWLARRLCMANYQSRGNQRPQFFSTALLPGEIMACSMADRCRYVDFRSSFVVQWIGC